MWDSADYTHETCYRGKESATIADASEVRIGLPAGGKGIRTLGPSRARSVQMKVLAPPGPGRFGMASQLESGL
jgi:hypothetical protein